MTGIKYYGSQVGTKTKIQHTTTLEPISLLYQDVYAAFKSAPYIIYVFWPLWPALSGDFCELAPTWPNLWACFLHLVLIVMQVPFILSVPLWLLFPGWAVILGVVIFMASNYLAVYLLNGPKKTFRSLDKFAGERKEHEGEQWIFYNGVAAGQHWLQRNIDRIALTFGRPVTGLHNRTNGIVFDVLQVLWQRNFRYATTDIRAHFTVVKALLFNPKVTKLVFILHSQGAIEGGMIIDLLLQEIPQDLMAKLEVYTFGCAANHFNNPRKHVKVNHSISSPPPNREHSPGKAIHHIEHYCHTKDYVARWGILHYINPGITDPDFPRFMGRVFQREGSGHMFGQHYFDNMFPLEPAKSSTGGIGGSGYLGASETNSFMEEPIEWVGKTRVGRQESPQASSETPEGTSCDLEDEESSDDEGRVGLFDESPINSRHSTFDSGYADGVSEVGGKKAYQVKNLSRLWQYRNGRCPRVDSVDFKVKRMESVREYYFSDPGGIA